MSDTPTVRGHYEMTWPDCNRFRHWFRWNCPGCGAEHVTPDGNNTCGCGLTYNVEMETEDDNDA